MQLVKVDGLKGLSMAENGVLLIRLWKIYADGRRLHYRTSLQILPVIHEIEQKSTSFIQNLLSLQSLPRQPGNVLMLQVEYWCLL
jgi:hypothetical protein